MGSDSEKRERGSADRDLYCKQLERLLLGAAAELGQRGNLAQVVATIERGGSGGGSIDVDGAMLRRIGYLEGNRGSLDRLKELGTAWRMLTRQDQATSLAHYVGTPRAPETLRSTFGEFAGVVLHRWLTRVAKSRERSAAAGSVKLAEQLEAVRAELAPLERELATIAALFDAPLPQLDGPPEVPESPPLVLSKSALRDYWRPYRKARHLWAEPLRSARQRRQDAEARRLAIAPLMPPLQAEQARLCVVLAVLHSGGDAGGDEAELVEACGAGGEKKKRPDLLPGGKEDLTKLAEADVRALHRAWRAARRKVAEAWAEDEEPQAVAAG